MEEAPKRVTARGIVIRDDKLLLMERWRDGLHYFSIPGGGVEEGEDLVTALHRELDEETGIVVKAGREVLRMVTPSEDHHIFLCAYGAGDPHLHTDSSEAAANREGDNRFLPRWVPIAELPELPLIYWEPLRQAIISGLQDGFTGAVKTITV